MSRNPKQVSGERRAITHVERRSSLSEEAPSRPSAAARLAPETVDVDAPPLSRLERLDVLARAFEALPEDLQMVVGLRYEQRCSFAEIAAILGVSEARVQATHGRAMLELLPRLHEPDGELEPRAR